MDFFEHQDRARRRTSALIGYFVLAVALIVLSIYAVVIVLFQTVLAPDTKGQAIQATAPLAWWQPETLGAVAGVVLVIVVIGSLYKIIALAAGGEAVARMLGGEPVAPDAGDRKQRRLLNVVEEIAIASGTPVPRVYVVPGDAINAFAAGFSAKDAVIGVTAGCMDLLTRDELQGVIAHEFSHILNGDMRLNIRLIGVLHGILVIALIGYWIFRMAANSGSSGGRGKKGSPLPFILFGLAIMAVGYIGVLFGKLIKSAVSRQREFLADASSVQFTRNPDGIAGALKKIGGLSVGSRIESSHAETASHLFFANGLRASWFNAMATHPPLDERIRRIDPAFDGDFAKWAGALSPAAAAGEDSAARTATATVTAGVAAGFSGGAPARRRIPLRGKDLMDSVGKPGGDHLAFAATVVAAIPEELKAAARDTTQAQALTFALLLAADPATRTRQLDHLKTHTDADLLAATTRLEERLPALAPESRLPLAEIAIGALRALTPDQFAHFKAIVTFMTEADASISLFEYALQNMIVRHLAPAFERQARQPIQYYDLRPLLPDAVTLLSTLAYFGAQSDPAAAERSFKQGAIKLDRDRPATLLPQDRCGLQQVDAALRKLAAASPAVKKRVLDACAECVASDNQTTLAEAELLRAVADTLGCPMPPLLVQAA